MTTRVSPVGTADRLSSVDAVRGASLLGILLMNILGFGLPGAAGDDPTIAGGSTGIDLWTWFTVSVLFEGKMRAMFSMLFGAGLILITDRKGGDAADIWIRRCLWLTVIGTLHNYFLWDGDILFSYGSAGLLLYPFRNLPVRTLITAGVIALSIQVPKILVEDRDMRLQKAEAGIAKLIESKDWDPKVKPLPLTEELKKAKEGWDERLKSMKPGKVEVEKQIAEFRQGYWRFFERRTSGWQWANFVRVGDLDAIGMMLFGMALIKSGALTAQQSVRFYLWMMAIGFSIGFSVRSWASWTLMKTNWDVMAIFTSYLTYDLSRLSAAVGHLGLLLLILKQGWLEWLTRRLAAVGQMALSNYILHSLICTTLFYGYGFKMYGKLARHELYYVVAGVWLFQLLASPVWLRHFQYGPLEWIWRSLTYWRLQPFRRMPQDAPEISITTTDVSSRLPEPESLPTGPATS